MRPVDVTKTKEQKLLSTAYNLIKVTQKPRYQIGDFVRISKYKHVFEKGHTPNWTTEIFKIRKIQLTNPVTYLLEDYKGDPVKGGFYELELGKSKSPTLFLVEKIVKRKGNKVYVKWLGFDTKHNSWINKNDVL